MRRLLIFWLQVLLCIAAPQLARALDRPLHEDVLILANERMPPEAGTEGVGASAYVAQHYAQQRSIPLSNILRLQTHTGESVSWDEFQSQIAKPVRTYLERSGMKDKINYIVPIYGVPYKLENVPSPARAGFPASGYSLDLFLASLNSYSAALASPNPYFAVSHRAEKLRFDLWSNPFTWKMYLVTRLDGPTALIAKGLVDKALNAEKTLTKTSGVSYFDYRSLTCPPAEAGYCEADLSVSRAFRLSQQLGLHAIFNDQSRTGGMITEAPKTLFAWGWYSDNKITGTYSFVEGALGAQLTSFTANKLRSIDRGTWVPLWLRDGITATWGASAEPYTTGYANGDILLAKFWAGYNFAESSYMALPQLNWMMVFIGDPLYAPRVFASTDGAPPVISNIRTQAALDLDTPFLPARATAQVLWDTDEPADSLVEYAEGELPLQSTRQASGLVRRHDVSLLRLEPGRTYRFRIRSRDRNGNTSRSEFQHLAAPPITP